MCDDTKGQRVMISQTGEGEELRISENSLLLISVLHNKNVCPAMK